MSAQSITTTAVLSSGLAAGAVIKDVVIAAAVTVTQGQALYKLANGTYGLCDNDVSLLVSTFGGIALAAGSPGQTIPLLVSDPNYTTGATGTIGATIWTSATAGGITITAADNIAGCWITAIGVYTTTTTATIGPGFAAGAVKP